MTYQATRTDLKVLLKRIEGKLIVALSWLSEDEREEVIESIDELYDWVTAVERILTTVRVRTIK